MNFTDMVLDCNKSGWYLLNCYQAAGFFRVNLQYRQENGATTNYFSEYADGDTPEVALAAAWQRASKQVVKLQTHQKKLPPTVASRQPATVSAQDKRIAAAMDKTWLALKAKNGTRG